MNNYATEGFNASCEQFHEVVHRNRAEANFLQFKHLTRSYKGLLDLDSFIKFLIDDYSQPYPIFVIFGKIALIVAVSSAPYERGFSV